MRVRVLAQNGGRTCGCHRALDSASNCPPFRRPRHNCKQPRTTHNGWNRQGQSVARDVVNSCEGTIVYLLRTTYLVKLDYLHLLRIVEIAEGRIDEGQMTILADAQHSKVRRISREQFAITLTFSRAVLRVAPQPVKFTECHFGDKSIDEETAEGLWRLVVHSEILIEMETNNSR